ncbi:MAG: DUF3568 family protein [Planctomycetota bacterium]
MRTKQTLLAILLIAATGLLQGCMLAVVGVGAAGTIAYIRGDLEAVESKPIDVVYEATLTAVKELELTVTEKSKDALEARIVVRDSQDRKTAIRLKTTAEETTKLSIRVGTFGSETRSRLIYQKIREHLYK